jgi:heptaprenyl diphosphate synthase
VETGFVDQQFELVSHYLHQTILPETHWPLLNEVIIERIEQTAGTTTMYAATLPLLTAHAAGGETGQVVPLAAAWFLYNLASDLFDDLQDGDRKAVPWAQWSKDQILMTGIGLFFAANYSLTELHVPEDAHREIARQWAQVGLTAAREQLIPGQNPLDKEVTGLLRKEPPRLEVYLRHVAAKSGLILSAVAWAGGRAVSAPPAKLAHLQAFGQALGMLVQFRDDIIDIAAPADTNDLTQGYWTLPLLFGLNQKLHPLHTRLKEICYSNCTQSADQLAEVQSILEAMHAFTCAANVIRTYKHKAIDSLTRLSVVPDPYLSLYVEKMAAVLEDHMIG